MGRAVWVALGTGTVITSAAAIGIGSAVGGRDAPVMTPAAYRDAVTSAAFATAEDLARCERLAIAKRETCRAEVRATELVRSAEIEARYRRTPDAARAVHRAQIEARYRIARARCDAAPAAGRDDCLIAAHAAKGRALLDTQAPYVVARGNA